MFRKGDEPIPGYRLEKFLGKGQFGEVWRTTAPGGTSAALKFIDLGGKQGIKEFRGVRRVKEIRHANLMPITALWMLDGEGNILGDKALDSYDPEPQAVHATLQVSAEETVRPEWLVVAMLLGKKNLADRLEECRTTGQSGIPVNELLSYMEEAAKGIDYLNAPQHDLGDGLVAIQHCDVKPANIMLIGDAAVVCDFGLARVLSDTAATATGMVGSPAYMAPECIERKPGGASDQYSLAISYVELRTGDLPFKEITYLAVLEANRSGELDLSRLTPSEQQVIRKATAVRPEDRYRSSLEMVAALRRAVSGTPTIPSKMSRGWMTAAAALLIGVPAAVGWIAFFVYGNDVRTTVLSLRPADAQVKINGKPQTLTADGKLTIQLRPGGRVAFEATHSGDYQPLRRELTYEQLQSDEVDFKLDPSGAWFTKRARDQIDKGDLTGAVESYRQAIQLDRESLALPPTIELKQHHKPVRIVRASPNSDWLASAGDDGMVVIWPIDANGPRAVPTLLNGHLADNSIESLEVSADGRLLVSGGWDHQVIVWQIASGHSEPAPKKVVLTGHNEDVLVVKITPDSRSVISAGDKEPIRLWRLAPDRSAETGMELLDYPLQRRCLEVSNDGRWLVSIDTDNRVWRWELSAKRIASTVASLPDSPNTVRVTALTPDGSWLVTGGEDGALGLIPILGSEKPRTFESGTEPVESLVVSADGSQVLAGHFDGRINRWDLVENGQLKNPQSLSHHGAAVVALAISKDSSFAVSGSWDEQVGYWRLDAKKAAPLSLLSHHGQVLTVAITPDGKWISAGCQDGTLVVWNALVCNVMQQAMAALELKSVSPTDARNQTPNGAMLGLRLADDD